jgi:hypothetical protein
VRAPAHAPCGARGPRRGRRGWPERTVVNDVHHHHTSVIGTMRERWELGKPFTGRDATAPTSPRCYPRQATSARGLARRLSPADPRLRRGRSSRSMHRCRRWRSGPWEEMPSWPAEWIDRYPRSRTWTTSRAQKGWRSCTKRSATCSPASGKPDSQATSGGPRGYVGISGSRPSCPRNSIWSK